VNLRPYQKQVVEAVRSGFREFSRQLAVCPTGSGKTVMFSHLAKATLPGRTLILAHREELVDQAIDKLRAATGIEAEKEMADSRASLSAPVVVASIQTMQRRAGNWPRDHFALVVCDEAHHAISDSWQAVLGRFSTAKVLGVTATPDRGDKRDLGRYFQNVAAEIKLFDLIADGYLSRISVKSVPLAIDLNACRTVAGDFADADLGAALDPYLDQIAAAIRDYAGFRKTLCFLPLIATSKKFVDACRAAGVEAQHVDGYSQDRAEILAGFAAGQFDLLSNAMLLTEGYDDPSIDCVVVLRPTRSRPLFAQMIGRGTRTAPAKENLLLLDFLWMHEKHSIVSPANLVAETAEEAAVIRELSQEPGGGERDLEELFCETQTKREDALRKKLEEQSRKKSKYISAEEFALQQHRLDLAEYQPVMGWEFEAVTDAQARALKGAKIDPATVTCKGQASRILGLASGQPASQKQKAIMSRMGYPNAYTATAGEARQFFAKLYKRAA